VAELPEEIAEEVLENLEREDSEDVKELLKYPEDSAGGIMSSDFISINEHATIKDTIEVIRQYSEDIDHIYQVYVLNDSEKLLGTVLLKSLLINPLDRNILSLVEEDLIFVTPDTDQEEVAQMMEKYDLISIPVVDQNRIMLGRITIDDIVDVIHEEAAEDIQKIAGLTEDEEISDSALQISKNRLPWLLVSLAGELISASVLLSFKATIEQLYLAGIFIPIIMVMSSNSGTQSAIVVVRGLATGDIWLGQWIKRIFKEFKVALFNGLISGIILLGATMFFWQSGIKFSLILSISLILIMINATMIGAIVPLILKKLKFDPAISMGPIVSTANDIISLIIYFTLITLFYFN
jgi:magnesium transporter